MTPAQLKKLMTATKLSFKWYGSHRKLEDGLKNQVAETVEAEADSIKASKMLYNPKLPVLRDINSLKSTIKEFWESVTTPHPEPGVRLLLKQDVETFNSKMKNFEADLWQYAQDVQMHRDQIITDARQRLGKAFNAGNYPADLASLFGFEVSYPSLEPPSDLPEHVYEQQKQLAKAKLDEAIQLAEAMFVQQFRELVEGLHERLTPEADGKKKVFRDSAVTNFTEFFDRFAKLNVTNNADLETLVTEAKELVSGIKAQELRDLPALKAEVAQGLAGIKNKLAPLVVNQPRRKIIKPQVPTCEGNHSASPSTTPSPASPVVPGAMAS